MSSHRTLRPGTWVLGVMLIGTLAGMGFVGHHHWRWGLTLFGFALLLGAIARLVLPEASAGALLVRGRLFDCAFLAVSGSVLVSLVFAVPVTG
jgi:hypothetical protein